MSWLEWLEATPVAAAVRQSSWLYPAIESAHIFSLGLLVGSAVMWDLRLLGASRSIAVSRLAPHLLRGARVGFAFAVLTGAVLFVSDATTIAANPAFRLKLVLILAAVFNAAVFHARPFRSVAEWDVGALPPLSARLAAVLSLTLWALVVVAGRFIAYV